MQNGEKKQLYGVICIALIIVGVSSYFQVRWAKEMAYAQLAQMIKVTVEVNPDSEQKWMLAFKERNATGRDKGEQILKRYGYTQGNLSIESIHIPLIITLISGIGIIVLAYLYVSKQKKQMRQRIEDLTEYLKQSSKGESRSLQSSREDEFSLLEDEVYKTVVELYQTRSVALNDKEILKDHIANITHQLKTPLTSMGMMCELLEETMDFEEQQLYLTKLQNQITRLDSLVHALLTFSKLDANVIKMEQKPVDVYILLLRVLELVESLAMAKNQGLQIIDKGSTMPGERLSKQLQDYKKSNIKVSTEDLLEEDMQGKVFFIGDMKWSIEAIGNLVKNCIEHTPENKQIKISYQQNPLYTLILIEDEGKGFIPEEIPYLFKRFYKGKNATKDSVGIGLALAKTIMEKQNGYIEAENRLEGGARFIIKIYSDYKEAYKDVTKMSF